MHLFHQNMRRFGGGAPARNAAYLAGFGAINAALPGNIGVAGFTEVTNNGAAAVAFAAGGLCGALGVNHFANIACGRTALAAGPEYITIGVQPGVPIVGYGRVFLNATGGAIYLLNDYVAGAAPPGAAWCNNVPAGATADYRGLVYIVVGGGGWPVICVAFLHNLYTFEAQRILVMGSIPRMLNLIAQRSPLNVAFIGGDFNSNALNPRGTRRIGFAYASSAGLAVAPAGAFAPPPPPPAFVAGGTTWAGNLYDYWYSTLNPAVAPPAPFAAPAATVNGRTLDTAAGAANLMSDHCASILTI